MSSVADSAGSRRGAPAAASAAAASTGAEEESEEPRDAAVAVGVAKEGSTAAVAAGATREAADADQEAGDGSNQREANKETRRDRREADKKAAKEDQAQGEESEGGRLPDQADKAAPPAGSSAATARREPQQRQPSDSADVPSPREDVDTEQPVDGKPGPSTSAGDPADSSAGRARHRGEASASRDREAGGHRRRRGESPDGGRGGGSGFSARALNLSKRSLGDGDVARAIEREVDKEPTKYTELDLSRNGITSRSMGAIVELCKRCPDLRILKLFNNQLDDAAGDDFREIFRACQHIEEVHMSHNNLTHKGVETIIAAADRELPRGGGPRPLWLRLEHNRVERTEDFARSIERSFASVCAREDRHRCTPRACVRGRRIHLPFFIEKPKGSGRGSQGSPRRRGGRSPFARRRSYSPPPRRRAGCGGERRRRGERRSPGGPPRASPWSAGELLRGGGGRRSSPLPPRVYHDRSGCRRGVRVSSSRDRSRTPHPNRSGRRRHGRRARQETRRQSSSRPASSASMRRAPRASPRRSPLPCARRARSGGGRRHAVRGGGGRGYGPARQPDYSREVRRGDPLPPQRKRQRTESRGDSLPRCRDAHVDSGTVGCDAVPGGCSGEEYSYTYSPEPSIAPDRAARGRGDSRGSRDRGRAGCA